MTLAVFVDGRPEDAEHLDSMPASAGPLTVGAGSEVYGPVDSLGGGIDDLRTYGRALTADEVLSLYLASR